MNNIYGKQQVFFFKSQNYLKSIGKISCLLPFYILLNIYIYRNEIRKEVIVFFFVVVVEIFRNSKWKILSSMCFFFLLLTTRPAPLTH